MAELKHCPFCGMGLDGEDYDILYPSGIYWREEDSIRTYHAYKERRNNDGVCFAIHCSTIYGGCGAEMHGDSIEEVIDKWNRRIV